MRALVAVVLALAVLYGGYWFVGSRALERGAEAWFAQQADAGFVAERESLAVRGFPSRFDLTVNGVRLADPASGFGWQAPFVQVFSLSYKPWHVIAAFPDSQMFQTPTEDISLVSTRLQASLIVSPGVDLALDRVAMVGEGLRATSTLGWTVSAETARFATRRLDDAQNTHEIGIEASGLAPDRAVLAVMPASAGPGVIETARLILVARFSAPLDRHAATTQPRLQALDITEGLIRWGAVSLTAKGGLVADAAGLAEGRVDLRLENWREAVDLAVAVGLVTAEVAPTWANALELLSKGSDAVDLPLTFARGRMSLGPLPLGPAPRLQ